MLVWDFIFASFFVFESVKSIFLFLGGEKLNEEFHKMLVAYIKYKIKIMQFKKNKFTYRPDGHEYYYTTIKLSLVSVQYFVRVT